LIVGYAVLILTESQTSFDAADWANRNSVLLIVAVALVSALGLAVQGAQLRRQNWRDDEWRRRRRRKYRPLAVDGHDLPPDLRALREVFRKRAV
jgi:hypothetical protein